MDRRRINGPAGGTAPPQYRPWVGDVGSSLRSRPRRNRQDHELRKIFLKTGPVPSASGSAYLELQPSLSSDQKRQCLVPVASAPKLTCVVHGPRPLPRSAPFTPHVLLSTHVKFAPFATRQRRGYMRDSTERDLAIHLETALRGVIIGDRWPKSGVDVIITILEGEEDRWWGDEAQGGTTTLGSIGGWGMMSLLASCITVASAAIAEAGIDCVDLVCGGVAALLKTESDESNDKARQDNPKLSGVAKSQETRLVLDPCPSEHTNIQAVCAIGYMSSRDEITEMWVKGDIPGNHGTGEQHSLLPIVQLEALMDGAVKAATGIRSVLAEAVKEAAELRFQTDTHSGPGQGIDVSNASGEDVVMKD